MTPEETVDQCMRIVTNQRIRHLRPGRYKGGLRGVKLQAQHFGERARTFPEKLIIALPRVLRV